MENWGLTPHAVTMGKRRRYKPPFLREWRKHRDMTQERLAEFIGCSVPLISMIERGERGYDQEFLEAAAEALQTSPDRILRINPLDPASDDSLFDALRRIPAGERPRVAAVIEALFPRTQPDPPAPAGVAKPRPTKSHRHAKGG